MTGLNYEKARRDDLLRYGTNTRPGATGRQISLIGALRKELGFDDRTPVSAMTVKQASNEIDYLIALKKRRKAGVPKKTGSQSKAARRQRAVTRSAARPSV